MRSPEVACSYCGRKRDCMKHVSADHPPTAARAWLKRTCRHEEKPCSFGYQAGVDVEGLREAIAKKRTA